MLPAWFPVLLLATAALAGAMLFVSLVPLTDFDGLAYHVAAPKRWLEVGSLRYLPTQLLTQWPMGSEMLYALLLPVGGAAACKPLVTLLAFLTAFGAFSMGRRLAGWPAGLLAGACYLRGAFSVIVGSTSVEPALAFTLTLSGLALIRRHDAGSPAERRAWFVPAALLAGFACCIKLSGVVPAMILAGVVIAVRPRHDPEKAYRRIALGAALALTAIACALPWYVRTGINTGNPIYPFAYGVFGGRNWNYQAAAVLNTYFRLFGVHGDSLAARQLHVYRDLAFIAGLTAAGLVCPFSRSLRAQIAAIGVFALLQAAASDQPRFLLPAIAFAAVVLGVWMSRMAANRAALGWTCALAIAALNLKGTHDLFQSYGSAALGGVSRGQYVRSQLGCYDACLWANAHLPPDARVLCGPDSRVYYLQRDAWFAGQVTQQDLPMDTTAAFIRALRQNHIDFFLFNSEIYQNPNYKFEVNVGWRSNEVRRLAELAAASEPLVTLGPTTVYRIRGADSLRRDADQLTMGSARPSSE
jgi:hypothetical protein